MYKAVLFISINIFLFACAGKTEETPGAVKVQGYYLHFLQYSDSLAAQLDAAVIKDAGTEKLQQLFKKTRLAYKRIAFLAEYRSPEMAKLINGPPVPEVEEEDNQHTIIDPEGFQVIEALLFPSYDRQQKAVLRREVGALRASFSRLRTLTEKDTLTDSQVFEALRKELFRVTALGLTGYDSDIAAYSIPETQSALTAVKDILRFYRGVLNRTTPSLYEECDVLLDQGLHYLDVNRDFNTFNRMHFITACAVPLSKNIQQAAATLGGAMADRPAALRSSAGTLFDKDAFDPDFYTADPGDHLSGNKIVLGRRLFFDPALSGNGLRSCASCHQPDKALTDGVARNITIDGKGTVKRNTLTLLNAGLQPGFFYDARVTYLEDQITDVLTNKDEMNGSVSKTIAYIKTDKTYSGLFKKAFPESKEPVTPYHLHNVIASYIRSLVSLNSPFDRYIRGEPSQLTPKEINGFNLYMGKARCATCHFLPLFNGVLPPDFNKMETEVIGVPAAGAKNRIDDDKGRYLVSPAAPNLYAFRTPTLRNIALTAPYMHNGEYRTLEEVLDFYNKGGGAGLGIQLPNQTLSARKLDLSASEQEDIIAFLKKLTDTAVISHAGQQQ